MTNIVKKWFDRRGIVEQTFILLILIITIFVLMWIFSGVTIYDV
jgi:hypothetical protein